MQNTNRPLDIAITGDGFLQVSMADGSTKYTRDGALSVNANGNLVTATGFLLEPAISVPTDAMTIDIGKDGTVNVTNSTGTTSVAGTLQLARFLNPSGLSSEGDNLLAETEASGTPVTGTAALLLSLLLVAFQYGLLGFLVLGLVDQAILVRFVQILQFLSHGSGRGHSSFIAATTCQGE